MSQTVLVTGATGLAGANICKLLTERGDHVRALARETADTAPLAALGVEVVTGDPLRRAVGWREPEPG